MRQLIKLQLVCGGYEVTLAEDAAYELVKRAWPYRNLPRSEFDAVVKQEGIDGLIKRLAQKNSPAAVGGSAPKKTEKK